MSESTYIQIDNEVIEAKGNVLKQVLKDQAESENNRLQVEQELLLKSEARAGAVIKLQALGLTPEEISAILS
jgi:hypothetical protein